MLLHAERSLPPQLDFIRGDFSSDKFNRFAQRYNRCFVVQLQTNIGAQVVIDIPNDFPGCLFAIDNAHHVVHEPGVFRHLQLPLDVVVRWGHNHIGGHLRNEAADLHPDAGNALGGGHIRAVHRQAQRSAVAADSLFQKPHHVRVIQRLRKLP